MPINYIVSSSTGLQGQRVGRWQGVLLGPRHALIRCVLFRFNSVAVSLVGASNNTAVRAIKSG